MIQRQLVECMRQSDYVRRFLHRRTMSIQPHTQALTVEIAEGLLHDPGVEPVPSDRNAVAAPWRSPAHVGRYPPLFLATCPGPEFTAAISASNKRREQPHWLPAHALADPIPENRLKA